MVKAILSVATAGLLLLTGSVAQTIGTPLVPSNPSEAPGQEPFLQSRNGVRLNRYDGRGGQLEVLVRDARFPGAMGNSGAWVPVCDSSFTDQTAEIMCKLLGYSYGRKYYAPGLNCRTNTTSNFTAGSFSCYPRGSSSGGRRLRADSRTGGMVTAHRDATTAKRAAAEGVFRPDGFNNQHRRRTLSYARYSLNISTTALFTCSFSIVACDSSMGTLAGVECDDVPLPPAPPPPPSPPSPPSAPPPFPDLIRIVGGTPISRTSVEPNLCSTMSPQFCAKYGRVELLLTPPNLGGLRVWAPLCAVNNSSLAVEVARVACQQEFDWPSLKNLAPFSIIPELPDLEPLSYTIPKGATIGRGDFNPANVVVWVSVEGPATTREPRTVQDFNLTLSALVCRKGNLFAVACGLGPA